MLLLLILKLPLLFEYVQNDIQKDFFVHGYGQRPDFVHTHGQKQNSKIPPNKTANTTEITCFPPFCTFRGKETTEQIHTNNFSTSTNITMQATNEKNLLFWDRLKQLSREKEDGEIVDKGDVNGKNVLRLMSGKNGGAFLTVNCIMQELLSANATAWPSSVSDDGLTVTLWLTDFLSGRDGYRRKFMLTFFDELSASRFFESFTLSLPCRAARGRTYQEMIEDEEDADFEAVEEAGKENEEEERKIGEGEEKVEADQAHREAENDGEGGGGKDTGSEEEEATDPADISDDFAAMLAMEQEMPWGQSQDFFHPQYPGY